MFVDDVAVYLGLSGEVKDALLDAEMLICEGVVEEAAFLRKTRAGGNWLTGGIVNDLFVVLSRIVEGGR
jgi:hypothetical protein